uniref:Nuclear Hormone Receptor family n=1 Tax=Steinernema glaseri TaxID=37863 RepID=A0A1I7YBW8_9BILA
MMVSPLSVMPCTSQQVALILSTAQAVAHHRGDYLKMEPLSNSSESVCSVESTSPPAQVAPVVDRPSTSTASVPMISPAMDAAAHMMPVPLCSICGADSTGIHFGVEACAACSAFFRRTVVLSKNYICTKGGNCSVTKDAPGSQKCRACRFQKCNAVGMDRSATYSCNDNSEFAAVQHRRDAIGRYSTLVKRESTSPSGGVFSDPSLTPPSPKSPRHAFHYPVLDEVLYRYKVLNQRRKLFYCTNSLGNVFDEHYELVKLLLLFVDNNICGVQQPNELTDFGECMYQLWRIEPRLCIDFICSNRHLAKLPPLDKVTLFKNFVLMFPAVEEPFMTWTSGGIEKDWWMMPNRTYIVFERADHYFTQPTMKALNLDKSTAVKLFIPSFQHAIDLVGRHMAAMNMTETEMVALSALLLFDPTCSGISQIARDILQKLRDQLFKDLINYYENEDVNVDDPETRLGNIILLISGVKLHALKTKENMQMLKIFDLVPRDKVFDEIVGIV